MNTGMSKKTWTAIIIIALVILAFLILQLRPKTAVAPIGGADQNLQPLLNTSGTTSATLKLGDHITVGTVLLTPTEVLQDSRCAVGLQCVQAGTVVLAVNASSDSGVDVIQLPLGTPIVQDGLTTTLTSVSPAPTAGGKISPGDYSFTLNIQQVINN
jgi:hypothetical protein